MKASLNWIGSYLHRPIDVEPAAEALTAAGFPTEQWEAVDTRGGRDWMMDVEVTSNRPDCLCHLGLARELGAAVGHSLKPPAMPAAEELDDAAAASDEGVTDLTRVDNEAPDLCPLYTARIIRGVTVGPSPDWLVGRLEAVGLRSVNNVVDVTNFVLLELGQPLHAFDLARLEGRRIVVRRARRGEAFTAIDGSEHTLADPMLVIADASRPVAIAGVMGGLETEVSSNTVDVLLESAAFNPLSVRRTSRALKLASDSSYRFERGVDVAGVDRASRRAAAMIAELAGGTIVPGVIRAGCEDPSPRALSLRPQRCRQLMGIDFGLDDITGALGRLGLEPAVEDGGERITCRVPTFRLDLQREVDLIEEVGRLYGLDRVPVREKIQIIARPPQASVEARRKLGQVLSAHGYFEAITLSFVPLSHGEPFIPDGYEAVVLDDERRKAEPMLRPSVLPSLLACRKGNQDAGNSGLRLYETASVWARRDGHIEEWQKLGMLCDAEDRQQAFRDLRGTIEEAVITLTGRRDIDCRPVETAGFAAAAELMAGGRVLGRLGVLDAELQKRFDLQTPVVVAELDLPPLIDAYPPSHIVQPLPRFPGIERDLSVIVDEPVTWADIEQAVRQVKPALLSDLAFITTYRGKPIEKGRKSVSFRMTFRDPDRTLRHEEVDPQVEAVVTALRQSLGAELRAG